MLSVQNLYKAFENQPLLKGVSFQVEAAETVCLLGPSGSGKSTILRIVAGLEAPDSGRVLWDNEDLVAVPAYQRHFGLMFQDYALFPHRTVAENIAFGLQMQRLPREEVERRAAEALEMVNLSGFRSRRVTDLSGGEQQRVALARALAPNPRLLMLDEPLAALDRTLREQLGEELRRILQRTAIPAIYVTHDQQEAFGIGDRIILLHDGQIAQVGPPAEVYENPASTWVAEFLGMGNLLSGRVVSRDPFRVETSLGLFQPGCFRVAYSLGSTVTLLLRPTRAVAVPAGEDQPVNQVRGVVEDVIFRGDSFRVRLRAGTGQVFAFDLPQTFPTGTPLVIRLKDENVLCLGSEPAEEDHLRASQVSQPGLPDERNRK